MTSIESLKSEAESLSAFLRENCNISLKHTHCLHAIAAMHGHENWNALRALGIPDNPPSAERLRGHLHEKHSVALSVADAEVAIAKVTASDASDLVRPSVSSANVCWPKVEPLRFALDEYDENSWRVINPNAIGGKRLDDLIESLRYNPEPDAKRTELVSKVRQLAEEYPGDIEALHTVAVSENNLGNTSVAFAYWRRAWSMVEPAVRKLTDTDKRAVVSYGFLDNRPFLRVLHGVTLALLRSNDSGHRKEGLKLAKIAYGLMRRHDALGFRVIYAGALAGNGKWNQAISFVAKFEEPDFAMLALQAGAMMKVSDARLEGIIEKLIENNPFASEILFRDKIDQRYNDAHGVSMGTWQEGASFLRQYGELWPHESVNSLWAKYRSRIGRAQKTWIEDHWSRKTWVTSVCDLLDSMAFLLSFIPPDDWGFRPLAKELLPRSSRPRVADFDVEHTAKVSAADLNRWLVTSQPRNRPTGVMLEWVLYNAVKKNADRIFLVPCLSSLAVLFFYGDSMEEFVSLKEEYGDASEGAIRTLCGHICYRTDKQPGQFVLETGTELGGQKRLIELLWNPKAHRSEITISPMLPA